MDVVRAALVGQECTHLHEEKHAGRRAVLARSDLDQHQLPGRESAAPLLQGGRPLSGARREDLRRAQSQLGE